MVGRAGRPALLAALAASVLVQLVVLYVPTAPSVPAFPNVDKVVHVSVFLVPVLVALLAGLRPTVVVPLFAAHAVLSEVVQHTVLPGRSGDPLDVVADLLGVALGVLAWRVVESADGRGEGSAAGG